ncbi:MAG: alpha-L-fucosidase [Lactobacillus helsingborgensis]|uniref:alpha-L-fucosidase n=1 Tax=Lactobacillus TaxID=1578 RepID=UPI000D6FB2E9|nr:MULTISPECIES: alpha-L-fucosidase [Lactobacillus]AWN34162.1 alpha-L-fucosidase [Lactobacillus helsingborgensis]MBI0109834.1 alpha-L-fucosidase [Lactobacillus sp. W8093]MCT6812382.1 alpha-L-fucosidase [Lactobacillus helsingborgensis]MCT6827369.1 alpha-L-fucosidase [Lactobacillus helsingborgensis]MCT6846344.1 alpha-L-fucosidase [Lactobacillus helsingborgensis]
MEIAPKLINFEKMGIGLFVHWGLYSRFAKGEWSQNILNITNYQNAFSEFNPIEDNIHNLVKLAKECGFKYIVLTAKHHDGFYLFDTKGIHNFDSVHTPFGKDVIKIFTHECHEQGIAPFIYYATYDWHNKKYQADFNGYLKELRQLIGILCTNYGKIGGFWFDGNWNKPNADWQDEQLYQEIRKLQPQAIITNNTGLGKQGISDGRKVDVLTFERGNPQVINHFQNNRYFAAETSLTLNRHWGNAQNDLNYVSARHLIEQICHTRKVGANLLINVGPEFDGSLNIHCLSLLEIIKQWMAINKEAVYNTNNFEHKTYTAAGNDNDFIKGNYLFVDNLGNVGNQNVVLGGEKMREIVFNNFPPQKIERIVWLDNGTNVAFKQLPEKSQLIVKADGFEYGTNLVERVAKIY